MDVEWPGFTPQNNEDSQGDQWTAPLSWDEEEAYGGGRKYSRRVFPR